MFYLPILSLEVSNSTELLEYLIVLCIFSDFIFLSWLYASRVSIFFSSFIMLRWLDGRMHLALGFWSKGLFFLFNVCFYIGLFSGRD